MAAAPPRPRSAIVAPARHRRPPPRSARALITPDTTEKTDPFPSDPAVQSGAANLQPHAAPVALPFYRPMPDRAPSEVELPPTESTLPPISPRFLNTTLNRTEI